MNKKFEPYKDIIYFKDHNGNSIPIEATIYPIDGETGIMEVDDDLINSKGLVQPEVGAKFYSNGMNYSIPKDSEPLGCMNKLYHTDEPVKNTTCSKSPRLQLEDEEREELFNRITNRPMKLDPQSIQFHKDAINNIRDNYESAILPTLMDTRRQEESYDDDIKLSLYSERDINAAFADKMSRLYFMEISNILEYESQLRALNKQHTHDIIYEIVEEE